MAESDMAYKRMKRRMDFKQRLEEKLGVLSEARRHDSHDGSYRNSEVLRSLSGLIPSVICIIRPNADLAIIYAGGECEKVIGLEASELANDRVCYASFVHPDDLPDLRREIDRAVEKGGAFSAAHRIRTHSGRDCWVIMHGSVANDLEEGRVIHCAVTSMDNIQPEESPMPMGGPIANQFLDAAFDDERRRAEDAWRMSEARFCAIFEGAAIGMSIVSIDGRLALVNPALRQMLGYSDEELVGSSLKRFVHPEDVKLLCGHFEDVASAKRARHETECRLAHRDGRVIWGLVTISLVLGADSEQRYVIFMVEDITARKRAEEALRDYSERMRSLAARLEHVREEERRGIAREIHDELGQTLTALKIDLFWLNKNLSRPEFDQGAALRDKAANMLELIDRSMESVHRISSELRPGLLDDLGLLPAIEWQLQQFKKRTGIEYRLSAGSENKDLAQDISTNVFRIFQEALTNIVRHAQASKIDVELMSENNWLILTVSDNGRGITPAETSNPESFGLLGMRERAVGLGGSAGFLTRKGGGTTVEVRIPLSSEEIENDQGFDCR